MVFASMSCSISESRTGVHVSGARAGAELASCSLRYSTVAGELKDRALNQE